MSSDEFVFNLYQAGVGPAVLARASNGKLKKRNLSYQLNKQLQDKTKQLTIVDGRTYASVLIPRGWSGCRSFAWSTL